MASKGNIKSKAALVGIPSTSAPYEDRISVPFPLDELVDLKLGQEIVITITGIINRLEGDEFYSCVALEVSDKKWRRTGNPQAEGIKQLAGETDGEGDTGEGY